ncbi:hypothetical protein NBRC3293_0699 [Gluconobacter oxydans NBRC 3293]|uniref:Uncharacterized protein n=1 Tax=Gluconobacter oxydans NBRC 3293 TaxID=1315969 RepID=A0A829WZ78_GLUOY|nr:hypothetical protein NBRC3293_0699 [Gluconobacter oxydans NBRC 3293]
MSATGPACIMSDGHRCAVLQYMQASDIPSGNTDQWRHLATAAKVA